MTRPALITSPGSESENLERQPLRSVQKSSKNQLHFGIGAIHTSLKPPLPQDSGIIIRRLNDTLFKFLLIMKIHQMNLASYFFLSA